MKQLKALIRLVSPARLRLSHLNTRNKKSSNQLSSLYLGIHKGEIQTDDDIQRVFYDEQINGVLYSRNLKNRLVQKLLNYIFLLEFDSSSPKHVRELYNCYKNYAAFQITAGLGLFKVAIPLAKRTIKKAIEFNLTELVASIARKLQNYYGNNEGNKKEFEYYTQLCLTYSSRLHAETQAEVYRNKIQFYFVKSRAAHPEVLPELEEYCVKVHLMAMEHKSYQLFFEYYKMEMLRYQILANHELVIQTSQKALKHFSEQNWPMIKSHQFTFRMNTIAAFIHLKQFSKADQQIKACYQFVDPYRVNYYILLFYQVLYAFHSKQYHIAEEAFDKAQPLQKIPSESIQEQWRITEAYIAFFTGRPFRIGKFLNQVPIFSKDKRGNNINLIIIQILFLLKDGRYGGIIDRVEALQLYTYRYLRKDETFRANCFIRLLTVMVKQDFHLLATQRHAAPLLKRMAEVPLNLARQGAEIELIPYEELWKIVVDMLDNQKHIVRRRPNSSRQVG